MQKVIVAKHSLHAGLEGAVVSEQSLQAENKKVWLSGSITAYVGHEEGSLPYTAAMLKRFGGGLHSLLEELLQIS